MTPAGFSQLKRLPFSHGIPLYSALNTGGNSVFLELIEPKARFEGFGSGGESLLTPIGQALRKRVERRLAESGISDTESSPHGKWGVYPNPAHCTYLLRERPPKDPGELAALALSLLRSLEQLHKAGLLFCQALGPYVLWNPRRGNAMLVGVHRTVPRRLACFLSMDRLRVRCAERWRSHRRPPDERTDILLCGSLLETLMSDDRGLETVSMRNVVEIMTAVDPEERYQSLASAIADVRRAGDDLMPTRRRFSYLRTYYASGRLYGVGEPESTLDDALTSLRNGGNTEAQLVAVSGEPGTGKSALCLDVIRRALDDRTLFLYGKFHSAQRSAPLSALTEAIGRLIEALFHDGGAHRELVASCVRSISAPSRAATASAIPELNLLLDEPSVSSADTGVPRKIAAAYAELLWTLSSDLPICLFLDDCQWADHATLEVVRLIVSRNTSRLLVVLSARNRPRAAINYFEAMLDDLIERSVKISRIRLGLLDSATFAALLSESTGVDQNSIESRIESRESCVSPALLVHEAQQREVRRAIQPLPDASGFRVTGSLRFESGEEKLREGFTERFGVLTPYSRRVVEIASALGLRFELSLLVTITNDAPDQVADALLDAVETRLIRPSGELNSQSGEFRFEHDVGQEAIYRSMSKRKRGRLHELIANRLEQSEDWADSSLVFDVADHAHRQRSLEHRTMDGLSSRETTVYFRRQCEAGNAAYRIGAFGAAAEYFRRACEVTDVEPHIISQPLHRCIGSLIAIGEFDRAVEILASLDVSGADHLSQARFRELGFRVELKRAEEHSLEERKRYARLYDDIRVLLRRYSVRLPRAESRFRFMLGLIKAIVGGRLMMVPSGGSEASELSIVLGRLLSHAATLAYIQSAELSMRVHLTVVRFVRRRNAVAATPYSFALLGALLAVALGRQEAGRRFGRIAERQLEDPGNADARGRTLFHIHGSIMPMLRPYRDSDLGLREAYLSCIEAREMTFAGLCSYTRLLHRFFAGESLGGLLRELEHTSNLVASKRGTESVLVLHQAVLNLLERVDEPWIFRGPAYDEGIPKGTHQPRTGPAVISGIIALAFGRYDAARQRSRLDAVERNSILAVPTIIIHDFLICFCGLVLDRRLDPSLERSLNRLRNAARHCQSNFAHLYLLVRAERERSHGRLDAARNLFERAAEQAERESCGYAAVIAYSRLSALARERGFAHVAAMFESTAAEAMERWRGTPPHVPASTRTSHTSLETEHSDGGRSLVAEAGGEVGGESYARSYLGGVDVENAVIAIQQSMESDQLFSTSSLRVGELAEHVGLTTHQLAELFSRHLHTSFARYVNTHRVHYAAEQIRLHPDVNLLDIAYRAGFSSKAAFNVAFKQGTGLTPSQYRREAQPSDDNDFPL